MKKTLLIAFMALSILAGCDKDEPIENGSNTDLSCSISKIESDGDTLTYSYDSQNRVIKIQSGSDYYETYDYGNNTVTLKGYDDGILDYQKIYESQNNRVTKSVEIEKDTIGSVIYTYTDTEIYQYNAEGYLAKVIYEEKERSNQTGSVDKIESGSITYTYANGNLVKTEDVYQYETGSYSQTTNFDYYLDKENLQNLGYELDEYDYYVFLTGKQSKNLIKKSSSTSRDIYNGVTYNRTGSSDFTYQFDNNGKPSKVTEVYNSSDNGNNYPAETTTYDLSLNCK